MLQMCSYIHICNLLRCTMSLLLLLCRNCRGCNRTKYIVLCRAAPFIILRFVYCHTYCANNKSITLQGNKVEHLYRCGIRTNCGPPRDRWWMDLTTEGPIKFGIRSFTEMLRVYKSVCCRMVPPSVYMKEYASDQSRRLVTGLS